VGTALQWFCPRVASFETRRAHPTIANQGEAMKVPSRRLRRHHMVIAIVAIVVAMALVLNYYLW
jgi:hypothetical protein